MAVKQVPMNNLCNTQHNQEKKIKAMQSEIELLKSFNHRNIVKYLGTHKDKDKFSIFLEFVPGGSLERIYKTYPMNETLI